MTALTKIDDASKIETLSSLQKREEEFKLIEQVVLQGDLSKLTPQQRVMYYNKVCESTGLNPMTQPFAFIHMNGKMVMYAKKDATEQLRKIGGISIEKMETQFVDDLYIVKVTARDREGRTDQSTGAVVIGSLKGEARANAIMKCETKAKRRATLSISGLGFCDETEMESLPGARVEDIDPATISEPVKRIESKEPEITITEEEAKNAYELLRGCDKDFKNEISDYLTANKIPSFRKMTPNVLPIIMQRINTHLQERKIVDLMEEE